MPNDLPKSEALKMYLDYLKSIQSCKEKTLEKNELNLSRLEMALGKPLILVERGSEIENACFKVASGRKLKWNGGVQDEGKHMRHRLGIVAAQFMRWAYRENLMERNPYTESTFPRPADREAQCLTQKQLAILLDDVNELSIKEHAIFRLILDTGVSRQELCSLKVSHINFDQHTLHITKSKTDKTRTLPFSEETLVWLKMYLSRQTVKTEYFICMVTGERLSENMLGKIFENISENMGFRITPHMVRHTVAFLWLKAGKDIYTISRLLGHDSIAMTHKSFRTFFSTKRDRHSQDLMGERIVRGSFPAPRTNTAFKMTIFIGYDRYGSVFVLSYTCLCLVFTPI